MTRAARKPRILAHRTGSPPRPAGRRSLLNWLVLAVLAGTGVAAFGLAPDTTLDESPVREIEVALPAPDLVPEPTSGPWWREERVQRGDTIGSLLARAGVADAEAGTWLRVDPAARALYQLRPGRAVHVATDDDGRLAALRFATSPTDVLSVRREEGRFVASVEPARIEVREAIASGEIASSLFAATDAAGVPDGVTLALAEIFGGDIDFLRDLRRGDRFAVVYETRSVDGEPAGAGKVLAAEFVNRGQTYRAFLWRHPDGEESYYADDGRPTRKAFLRTPMEFSRMTSGFSLARFHPILQSWRAHKGVDYAAPVGTPVRATGDATVSFAGSQNGYGNVVVLQHRGAYTTLYAHLSGFAPKLRAGTPVRQGETIGYVGATGWATGPHLHYEFRIAGEPRDPTTLALPHAIPLPAEHRAQFDAHVAPLARDLALARDVGGVRVASNR